MNSGTCALPPTSEEAVVVVVVELIVVAADPVTFSVVPETGECQHRAELRIELRQHARRNAAGQVDADHFRIGIRSIRQRQRGRVGDVDDRDLLLGVGSGVGEGKVDGVAGLYVRRVDGKARRRSCD